MRITSILTFTLLTLTTTATAQHDPQRNATQAIATGNFEKAETQLAKANADDPETLFVRTMLHLKQNDTAAATKMAQAALDAGLPFNRLVAGPRELFDELHKTETYQTWAKKYGIPKLLHGPMVGAVTDASASVWVRTVGPAEVQVKIGERTSPTAKTSEATDFTAVVTIDGLQPATKYDYTLLVDGKPTPAKQTQFRTFPAEGKPGKFSVAFGGGAGYVPKWEYMWDTIRSFQPDAMLMLGDNVYIDQPQHSLCQDYGYYRRQARPAWRRLTASTAIYSIYDDHDFGTNDCVPGPDIEKPAWKRTVWNRFRNNWVNPYYGGGEKQPGCWHDFYIADVHFILVDGRYYRDRKGGTMLGPVQKKWLKQTLKNSRGTFKVLTSPVPWTPGIKPGSKDPWDGYPEERDEIFSFLKKNDIEGVFLVAADRHRTDLRKTGKSAGYDLIEFESSKLTNRHTHGVVKTEGLIWGYNKTCSFGLMKFNTTGNTPHVTFQCITIDGEILHEYELKASALKSTK